MTLIYWESGEVEGTRHDVEVLSEFTREGLTERFAGIAEVLAVEPYAPDGAWVAMLARLHVHEFQDRMTSRLPVWLFSRGLERALDEAAAQAKQLIEERRRGSGVKTIYRFGGAVP